MNRRNVLGIIFSVGTLVACTTPSLYTKLIEGEWAPESAILGGVAMPISAFQGAILNLMDNHYSFGADRGVYKLLSSNGRLAIDILGIEGPNKGRTLEAIFKMEADRLIICYELGAEARPTEFESTSGSKVLLIIYHKAG